MFDSSYLNSGIIKKYSTGRNTYFSMAGVNFSQVMEKKMNKIFSVLLLVTFSLGIMACSSEDPSGATSQLGQVLDQPNSTDDRNSIDLPVVTLENCYLIDSSTIDNSTVDKSSISDNSSIKDSTVKNCSTVTLSIIDNSSTVDNSTISSSTINNSSICVQSTIDNSTIDNSTVCNSSTVRRGTTVRNSSTVENSSTVCYSTIDNSTIDNSSVCSDNVSFSFSIINETIRNQIMIEQTDPIVERVAITSATGIQNKRLNTDDIVFVTVTFDEIVIVAGTPKISLLVGGSDNRTATYVSGSGSNQLVFTSTILAGDNDVDGIEFTEDAFYLDNSTIRDASGNYADITHSYVNDNDNYTVDTTDPTVDNTTITSSTSPTKINEWKIPRSPLGERGDTCDTNCYIFVTATFSESVFVDNVSGNPFLKIVVGLTGSFVTREAAYSSGNESTRLVFRYAIQESDPLDNDGIHILKDAIDLNNGGTIKDAAGNNANTDYSGEGTGGIVPANSDYEVKNW